MNATIFWLITGRLGVRTAQSVSGRFPVHLFWLYWASKYFFGSFRHVGEMLKFLALFRLLTFATKTNVDTGRVHQACSRHRFHCIDLLCLGCEAVNIRPFLLEPARLTTARQVQRSQAPSRFALGIEDRDIKPICARLPLAIITIKHSVCQCQWHPPPPQAAGRRRIQVQLEA